MDNSLRSYASTFSAWWRYSDAQVRSADYVKLRSISVAYTLPDYWTRPLHLGATKLSFQVNNLLTWAKAGHHIDPETYGLNSGLIDYVALKAAGGPTKDKRYAKGGNPEVLNYAFQGGPTENPAYTYGMISPELVKLYGDNDLRLNLFFKTKGNSAYFFDNGSGAALWNTSITYSKFFYSSVGMRTAEVYLIKAEAEARLGDIAASTTTLNALRAKRIEGDEAVLSQPATEKEAVENVITERRKELLFGFHRCWDQKRLNTEEAYQKTITRTFPLVDTSTPHQTYTLSPTSNLYIIPFPKAVREKNPNLTVNKW